MRGLCIFKVKISCCLKIWTLCCLPAEPQQRWVSLHCTRGMRLPDQQGAHPACSICLPPDQELNFKLLEKHRRQSWCQCRPESKPLASRFRALLYSKGQIQAPKFSYQSILVSSAVLGTSEELHTYFLTHGEMNVWMKAHSVQWVEGRIPLFLLLPLPPSPKSFTDRTSVPIDIASLERTCQINYFTSEALYLGKNAPPPLLKYQPFQPVPRVLLLSLGPWRGEANAKQKQGCGQFRGSSRDGWGPRN